MDPAGNKSSTNLKPLDHVHFLFVFLFLLPVCGWGQATVKVEVCDLVRQPEKYSHQWIEVRGSVNVGFEDFTLHSRDCGKDLRQVWLAYGGDEPTPVISTVNDHDRRPGSILKFDGIPVPLEHNAELELFKGRLEAQRLEALASSYCGSHCNLYKVTATFSGLFLAAPPSAETLAGYGHILCCHLLVIEKVTGVEAVRTEVPAGGRFACSTESWQLDEALEAAVQERRACTDLADCRKAGSEPLRIMAEHWHDKVELYQETDDSWEWISPDMLIAYKLVLPAQQTGKPAPHIMAQRTVCKPTEAPYPPATQVRCRSLHSDFNVSKKEITEAEHWTGDLEEISRAALKEAARQWGVPLMATLSPIQCEKPVMLEGDQSTWCQWSEPTAMQEFTIQISRSHFLRKDKEWNKVPWTLTGGTGTVCVAETK
jgi:hypothetical protein